MRCVIFGLMLQIPRMQRIAISSLRLWLLLALPVSIAQANNNDPLPTAPAVAPPPAMVMPPPPSRAEKDQLRTTQLKEIGSEMTSISAQLEGAVYQVITHPQLRNDEALITQIFTDFSQRSHAVWERTAATLEVSVRQYMFSEAQRSWYRSYIKWYTENVSMLFEYLPLSLERAQTLLWHYDVIGETEEHLLTGDTRLALSMFRKKAVAAFTPDNQTREQRRQELVALILDPQFNNPAFLEQSLISTSEILHSRQDQNYQNVPEGYRWLVGLTELMLDGDRAAPSSHELSGTKLKEAMFEVYLNIYEQSARDLSVAFTDDLNLELNYWASSLVVKPLVHIAQLKKQLPLASRRATQILQTIKSESKSALIRKQATAGLDAITEQRRVARKLICQNLIRSVSSLWSKKGT